MISSSCSAGAPRNPRGAADAEEFLRDDVHALVGALRGEDRGDEEFERIAESSSQCASG